MPACPNTPGSRPHRAPLRAGGALRRVRLAVLGLALFRAAVADGTPAPVADPPPPEYEVKAAFLYNFAKFVEWPSDKFPAPGQPFVMAVLGRDPFGATLDRMLADKTVSGRPIVVRRCARAEEAREAHLVFVSESERYKVGSILRRLAGHKVLTVGDMTGFARRGGIINFKLDERKVKFEINPEGASREDLRLSSQLLKLATLVRER